MERAVRHPGRSRRSTSFVNNSGRREEVERLGLRFSSNTRVREVKKVIESSRIPTS